MIQEDLEEYVPVKKYEKNILSRGTSNLGEFLALDINNLTSKELAEWVFKVRFEYPDDIEYRELNFSIEDLLRGEEVTDIQKKQEFLKSDLEKHKTYFLLYEHKILNKEDLFIPGY
jgi:hypothetical protein